MSEQKPVQIQSTPGCTEIAADAKALAKEIRALITSGATVWKDVEHRLATALLAAQAVGNAQAVDEAREAMCARIKAADDAAHDRDYMLDSNNCISVIRGTWKGPLMMDCPPSPLPKERNA